MVSVHKLCFPLDDFLAVGGNTSMPLKNVVLCVCIWVVVVDNIAFYVLILIIVYFVSYFYCFGFFLTLEQKFSMQRFCLKRTALLMNLWMSFLVTVPTYRVFM